MLKCKPRSAFLLMSEKLNFTIKELSREDYPAVAEIYGQGVEKGRSTFATEVPDFDEWDATHHKFCRFGAFYGDKLIGWAAISPELIGRPAYNGCAELSVYVHDDFKRHGAGKALIDEIVKAAPDFGIWTLMSRICSCNIASVKLHEKCGFRLIGFREKPAKNKFGEWQDVTEMELRL